MRAVHQRNHPGLIVDLFAGGGGASTGLEAALGRDVDIAINHSPTALAVHEANHPRARHFTASVWDVDPHIATGGRPVHTLWASPDCTHFSRAKGGRPRQQNIRSLAWVVRDWARAVRPRLIVVENVDEFRTWGPLDDNGDPIPERTGETFEQWRGALELLGYSVDHRVLDASRYGAPTKRKRLFVVARADGKPVQWPLPTHGPGLEPYRSAAECIDWSLTCPSIFGRKRPLAEKTLWRVAEGLHRFVFEAAEPFIVRADLSSWPSPVVSAEKQTELVAFLAKHFGGVVGHGLDRPIGTITARDHHSLVTGRVVKLTEDGVPPPSEAGRVQQVRAFLTTYYGNDGTPGCGSDLRAPMRTLRAKNCMGLVTVHGVGYQLIDIGMRMLEPHELLKAQFGRFAAHYDLSRAKTKSAQVRLIGNSVCPEVAEQVVRANVIPRVRRLSELGLARAG